MIKERVLPADTFMVINRTVLNDQDRKLLIMLYQPIIGSIAVSLYFTLWSYLDKMEFISCEWTHHHLMTSLRFKLEDVIEAREKLEGIGLLKTYIKKGDINNFVYELYSPLEASEFLINPVLSVSLYNNVGASEYEKIIEYFKIPKINMTDYEEITCRFHDVYDTTSTTTLDHVVDDIKKRSHVKLEMASRLDVDNILSLIPEELLNLRSVTTGVKEFIHKLGFIYNMDDSQMSELIKNSINEKKQIDRNLLKDNCRNFYQFETSGKLPSLIHKSQPEYLRKPVGDSSKRAKVIYQFETTSPYEFLMSKHNGGRLSKAETSILEYLLIDMNLNPGVVNVLIDYVLKESNNKLVRSYVEAIAGLFSRSKIETVEQAMKLAGREHQNKMKRTTNRKVKKVEEKPEWFDSEVEKKQASLEKQEEMKKMLSEFE